MAYFCDRGQSVISRSISDVSVKPPRAREPVTNAVTPRSVNASVAARAAARARNRRSSGTDMVMPWPVGRSCAAAKVMIEDSMVSALSSVAEIVAPHDTVHPELRGRGRPRGREGGGVQAQLEPQAVELGGKPQRPRAVRRNCQTRSNRVDSRRKPRCRAGRNKRPGRQ